MRKEDLSVDTTFGPSQFSLYSTFNQPAIGKFFLFMKYYSIQLKIV